MKTSNKLIKESKADKSFIIGNYIILAFVLVIVLYPIIYVVSASFSSPQAVIGGEVWLFPVEPTLMGYEAVFKNNQILVGFKNSFISESTLLNFI